jgi:CAAX protease family protein
MQNLTAFAKRHPVLSYYVLTFVISYGVMLLVILTRGLPATGEELNAVLPMVIPLFLLGPAISGLLMTALVDGRAGFRDLGTRLRRWRVGAKWYVVALVLAPVIGLVVGLGLSLFSPSYLPGIFTVADKASRLIMNFSMAVITGICEEIGWTGFATPKLRQRYGWLRTGLIVGVLWGLWHILPMAVFPSVAYGAPFSPGVYVALRSLSFLIGGLVAFRVLMLWVYENTQSLLIMALMHFALTFSNMLFTPEGLAGISNFVLDLAGIVVTWLAAAIVLAANRGRMHAAPGAMPRAA